MRTPTALTPLTHVSATRYVVPLREGGSLPGVVEADDLGTYVVKFSGAGQGIKVLVAEVVVGELARALGLRVPRLVTIDLPPAIARFEADEEVQDLLNASPGVNLGVDLLPGALGYDGARGPGPEEAARILWLDALTANVDRTPHNPNLVRWHRDTWLIDHGAALWFHHAWPGKGPRPQVFADQSFDRSGHVLVDAAARTDLADVHRELAPRAAAALADVVALVPDVWLEPLPRFGLDTPEDVRGEYVRHLRARLDRPQAWLGVAP